MDRMLTLDANRRPSINDVLAAPLMKQRISKWLSATVHVREETGAEGRQRRGGTAGGWGGEGVLLWQARLKGAAGVVGEGRDSKWGGQQRGGQTGGEGGCREVHGRWRWRWCLGMVMGEEGDGGASCMTRGAPSCDTVLACNRTASWVWRLAQPVSSTVLCRSMLCHVPCRDPQAHEFSHTIIHGRPKPGQLVVQHAAPAPPLPSPPDPLGEHQNQTKQSHGSVLDCTVHPTHRVA